MNPPQMQPGYQQMQDAEHLRLLTIFHYIFGGLCYAGSLFGLFYMLMGTLFTRIIAEAGTKGGSPPPPPQFGWMFIAIGAVVMLICLAMGTGCILSARWMKARRNRTFCMVVAGFSCLSIPFGTAIGVFTLIVLGRPTVALLFNENAPATTRHA